LGWSVSVVAPSAASGSGEWVAGSDVAQAGLGEDVPPMTLDFDLGSGLVKDSSIDWSQVEDAESDGTDAALNTSAALAVSTTAVDRRSGRFDREFASRQGIASTAVAPLVCDDRVSGWQRDKREIWGRSQGFPGVGTAKASHGRSTNNTMGVAVQSSGGVWKSSGTRTREAGISASLPASTGSYRVGSRVNYQDISNDCMLRNPYRSRPHSFADVASDRVSVSRQTPSAYCRTRPRGADFTKNSGKNVTYSHGITVHGIGLSAQAGWESTTKIYFDFTEGSGRLCGPNVNGLDVSSYVVMRPPA
jgi:hypothetical protein